MVEFGINNNFSDNKLTTVRFYGKLAKYGRYPYGNQPTIEDVRSDEIDNSVVDCILRTHGKSRRKVKFYWWINEKKEITGILVDPRVDDTDWPTEYMLHSAKLEDITW